MRRGPVVAAVLVICWGLYFQASGNSNKVLADSTSAGYPINNSAEKGVKGPMGAGSVGGLSPSSPLLASQINSGRLPGSGKKHRVVLTWTPSVPMSMTGGDDAVSYNVYRCSGATFNCVRLNPDPVAAPEYVDNRVRSGSTYYYATSAVNREGRHSRLSNMVKVVIPFP